MDHFAYRDGALHAESVPVPALASAYGTPLYCMSRATLERHYRTLDSALQGLDRRICYALKANPSLAVVRVLAALGAGADVVSGGELVIARAAGVDADRIVFSGVGKTQDEMIRALTDGVGQFNVESMEELDSLAAAARTLGLEAPVAIRVNPDVDAGSHDKISTGRLGDKFGVPIDEASAAYERAASLEGLRIVGVDVHIGSQLPRIGPFEAAFRKIRALADALRAGGRPISRIDLGGGVGAWYGDGEVPPSPVEYGNLVRRLFGDSPYLLIFEPGRMIAANAGVLIARILYVKRSGGRRIAILDAGMNDLMRPALYGAHHGIVPVAQPEPDAPLEPCDVVGPVCETGDAFASARPLPPLRGKRPRRPALGRRLRSRDGVRVQ